MRPIEFDVIAWDGKDPETIEHFTAQEAWSENFIEFDGNKLVLIDDTIIIREFTGLYDKNGNKIYEGDIVKDLEYNKIYIVGFEEGCFDMREKIDQNGDGLFMYLKENIEVIGNIHQNKELLK
jgi:uncharacterized phage protein (TIGR01671 family)